MPKKIAATFAVFLTVGACVLGAGFALEPDSAVRPLSADSPCPVVACASGECHGFDDVPEPDGIHEMTCPETDCSAVECHAWDTLQGRYRQASDASMNLWILAPMALVTGLVVLVGALSRSQKGEAAQPDEASKGGCE
ncbi:hypothetical protein [Adlercreutzia sp. ZJ242]|uniref:hypothetical protein n=1 Tax=Adlercreutzia sp. ZJ242 TaxID=2709409 RepID=UPI001F152D7C|nr:hypothetical protein [Adlercreutzia sp. ZJ242]